METLRPGVSEDVCRRAMQHAASVFKAKLQGGPALYSIDIQPALANAALVVEFGESMPQIDQLLTLRIGLSGGSDAVMQVELSRTPLYYFTSSLGFADACVTSFTATVRETIHAWHQKIGLPEFPAPVHTPNI